MRTLISLDRVLGCVLLLGGLQACVAPPTDDDAADDDASASDDDSTAVDPVTLSGTVFALNSNTGEECSAVEYARVGGRIIVYVTSDGSDISSPLGKQVLTGPGAWSIDFEPPVGTVYVVAIADNGDTIITAADALREHASNPITPGTADLGDVDVTFEFDVPLVPGDPGYSPGGGGGGGGDDDSERTTISGEVVLVGLDEHAVMVVADSADFTQGPWDHDNLSSGPGEYSVAVANSRGSTSLLAYLDSDDNGMFEPSDTLGTPAANPYLLGLGDREGITIAIPTVGVVAPQPAGYTSIFGTVIYEDWSGGAIELYASAGSPAGLVYAHATLMAPGNFALRVPPNTANIVVWGIADHDGDTVLNPEVDDFDDQGPFSLGTLPLTDVQLDLHNAPRPGTIAGIVSWDQPIGVDDRLFVALFPTGNFAMAPTYVLVYDDPTGAQPFAFDTVPPGTWWVGTHLDVGGNNPTELGPEDPTANTYGGLQIQDGEDYLDVYLELAIFIP